MHICLIGLESLSVLMPGFETYRTGGEQVQVSLLAKALVGKGYRVTLVVLDYGQAEKLEYQGIQVVKVYGPNDGLPVVRFIYPRVFKLWRALLRINADVYYTSCAGYNVGLVALFSKIYNKKSIYRVAHDNDCDPKKLLIALWRDRKLYEYGLRRQDHVLVQSDQQSLALTKNYGVKSHIAGMLVDRPDEVIGFDDRDIDILWVNNIRQFKRPDLVIELAKILPEFSIHMIGGPNDPDLYKKIVSESDKLTNLKFYGAVPYREINKYYTRAKIFINTSDSEGFPNSYLQSWIRGAPIVVFFDPDGIVVRNSLGLKADNVQGMATIIRNLLANQEQWTRLSSACLKYMNQNFSEDKILVPYIDAIEK